MKVFLTMVKNNTGKNFGNLFFVSQFYVAQQEIKVYLICK